MKKEIKLLIIVVITILVIIGIKFLVSSYSKNYEGASSKKQFTNVTEKESPDTKEKKIFLPELFVATNATDKISIEEVRDNKPMVINYWASWCPPCRMELPGFNAMYNKYKDKVTFMFLSSVDGSRETIKTASEYIKSQNFDFKPYFDIYDIGYALGLRSLPVTIFLASNGEVIGAVMGAISEEGLEKQIKSMIE